MKKRTKIVFLSLSLVVAATFPFALLTQFGIDNTNYQKEYINSVKPIKTRDLLINKDGPNVQITNEPDSDFVILQLSDTHFTGDKTYRNLDLKCLKAIYEMVNYVKPDLVIYTGDNIYPSLAFGSNNNIKSATILSEFLEKLEVPFLYEYGNHDTEYYARGSYVDINEIFQANPYCLALDDKEVWDKKGRLSQVVEIRNSDSSLNQALVLLDSGSYKGSSFLSGYDKFNEKYASWYENKLKKIQKRENLESVSEIPSLAFFHIPPFEYKKAAELYKKGSDEVTYLFGENKEGISSPNEPSEVFDKMVELKSTKAMFFGHDHTNYMALRYKGIEMYYGHAIDYRAYPTIKYKTQYRGGNIITLHQDSSYEVKSCLLKDIVR